MKTRTSVHPFQRPIAHAAGWLLLAVTIWLYGFMGNAQAQVQTPAKPAMPALFLEDTSPKPLVPMTESFREAVKTAGWSVLGVTNMSGILSKRAFTPHPVPVIPAKLKNLGS